MKRRSLLLTTVAVAGAAVGCSGPQTSSSTPKPADLLGEHGLSDLSVAEVIDALEADPSPRPRALRGSVRADALVLSKDDAQQTVSLPADQFYLSIAPFADRTHDCFFHNLGTCQGELAGQELRVVITQQSGATLVDETTSTHANGFVGFWLPRHVSATLTVTLPDGRTGSLPVSTADDSPTCLTTLKLT